MSFTTIRANPVPHSKRTHVGNGWNEDEMANHGTAFASRHKLARERIEAMKVIRTETGILGGYSTSRWT